MAKVFVPVKSESIKVENFNLLGERNAVPTILARRHLRRARRVNRAI